jgi:hypothetical protein
VLEVPFFGDVPFLVGVVFRFAVVFFAVVARFTVAFLTVRFTLAARLAVDLFAAVARFATALLAPVTRLAVVRLRPAVFVRRRETAVSSSFSSREIRAVKRSISPRTQFSIPPAFFVAFFFVATRISRRPRPMLARSWGFSHT